MNNTSQLTLRLMATSAFVAITALPLMAFAADAPGGGVKLEEVVVTAQRRSERLQQVPIAVTAANAQALSVARVENIENIATLSPSISFTQTNLASSSANIQIRGIGTTGNSRSFEGAVGVFVDGVYRTRSGQALTNFLDIDSLEILKGPQGTLFGKNTSAGALLLSTAAPSTSAIGGNYEATYGNYNYYLVKAAINVPISPDLAVRVAAMQTDHDGYVKNADGGTENQSRNTAVKAQILWLPKPGISLRLIGDYAESVGNCCYGVVRTQAGPTTPLINFLDVAAGGAAPSANWKDYQGSTYATPSKTKDYGITLLANADLGPGTLHSVTAARRYSVNQVQDALFSGANILTVNEGFDSKLFSQEFSYTGHTDWRLPADYVVGAYYSHEDIFIPYGAVYGPFAQAYFGTIAAPLPVSTPPGPFVSENMSEKSDSYAFFAHYNVKLNDKWNFIIGARYSNDKKVGGLQNGSLTDNNPFDFFDVIGHNPSILYHDTATDSAVSGTAGVQYHVKPNAMLYLTYNRGFKSGGINLDPTAAGTVAGSLNAFLPPASRYPAIPGNPVYKPETVDAVELGAKIDWLDHRARTNLAVFYNALQNLQVAQFLGVDFTVLNAPTATVYGLEFEQLYKVNESVTLSAAGTWLPEAKFGSSAALGAPLSGRRFASAPDFAGQVAVALNQPINDAYAVVGRFQVQYTSSYYTNTAQNSGQDGFALLNANLGVKSLRHGWTLEAWAQNLADQRYITQHFEAPVQTGTTFAYVGAPRTFGMTLRGSF